MFELHYLIKIFDHGFDNKVVHSLHQVLPENVKAIQSFSEEARLSVEEGDLITVIGGRFVMMLFMFVQSAS